MAATRIIGIVCLAVSAGCAGVPDAPPGVMAPSDPSAVEPSVAEPNQARAVAAEPPRSEAIEATVAPAPPPAEPRPPEATGNEVTEKPVAGTPAPPSISRNAAKAAQLPAKAPARVPVSRAAVERPLKKENPAPAAKMPEPPLDIAALKARLRDTDAIGVFTKLALKNQVDDLLQQFRAHYLNGQKGSVAALRQPYDMLVLKVLALIQDSDPSLARTISGSRESIWGILADPEKFNSVN